LALKSAEPVAASVAVGSSAHDHTQPCRTAAVEAAAAGGRAADLGAEVSRARCSQRGSRVQRTRPHTTLQGSRRG
jgi:hypothetical protein